VIDITSALITGITGQDGSYLAQFLLKKGYTIFGTYNNSPKSNFWRLDYLGIRKKVKLLPLDITNQKSIKKILKQSDPKEVYNFAAQSLVGHSFETPIYTNEITGFGVLRILETIKEYNKKIKFYQASSSEMYGLEKSFTKNESTQFNPISPYAVAKLYGYHLVRLYRNTFDMFACNGILFNHESPLRGLEFVTRKITNSVAKIKLGLQKNLVLGNLKVKRDWGYAPDYVEGIWLMMQQKKSDDFILATNETHTVEEFAKEACKIAGIPYSVIKSNKKNFRPFDIKTQKGDYSKVRKNLGWKPKTTFKELVKIMVESDIQRLSST
jgi:GDPmannose 4,6-dehydratase